MSEAGKLLDSLTVYLGPQDQERAAQFRFPEDRARFVLGRALLGKCLDELGMPARPLDLTYTAQKRPLLTRNPELQFSISHAGDFVVLAISFYTLLGIDVEQVANEIDYKSLAENIFAGNDLSAFQELPADKSIRSFFQAWTAKEAWLKAQGIGILEGLTHVSVPLQPAPSPLRLAAAESDKQPWLLQTLPLPADYVGNLVWNDPLKSVDFAPINFT